MTNFRAVLTFAVIGTLLGILLATLIAPSVIAAEQCGFAKLKVQTACTDTIEAATGALVRDQLYGGGAGTALGIGLGIFFNVRRGKKKVAAVASEPVAPKV